MFEKVKFSFQRMRPMGWIFRNPSSKAVEIGRRRIPLRRRLILGLSFGVTIWLISLGPAGMTLERKGYDLLFALRGPLPPPDDLIIVSVDDRSFAEIGQQWPWPRSLHAKMAERLRRAGARAIAFDILFDQPSIRSEDLALSEALSRAGNVVQIGRAHV